MLINSLYLILFVAFTCFMVNRLYVGLSQKQITIKGARYARDQDAFCYWSTMAMAAIAFALGLALSCAGIVTLVLR